MVQNPSLSLDRPCIKPLRAPAVFDQDEATPRLPAERYYKSYIVLAR